MLVLSSTLPNRLVAPVLWSIASTSEVLPAPPWPIITILRISPVLATFGSPNKGYNGLSAINAVKRTSIWKKALQNKPPLWKKSDRTATAKTELFLKNASFKYPRSKWKKIPLLQIFLAQALELITMVLLDINLPQRHPLPYVVYQPPKILHVVVLVMGRWCPASKSSSRKFASRVDTAKGKWDFLKDLVIMSKRELIDCICEINKSAKPEFLSKFEDDELKAYLEHLMELDLEELLVCAWQNMSVAAGGGENHPELSTPGGGL
jgi:hypothetical protein